MSTHQLAVLLPSDGSRLAPGVLLARVDECDRILRVYGASAVEQIVGALDRQFRIIHNRAQLLLGICGVLISASVLVTTGKIIGRPLQQHRFGALPLVAENTSRCPMSPSTVAPRSG